MFLTQVICYGTAIPTTRTHDGRLSVVGPTSTRRPSPCHSLRLQHVDSACRGRIMIICKTLTRKNQDHIKDSVITLMITGCPFVVCLHELEIQNGNQCRTCLNIWHFEITVVFFDTNEQLEGSISRLLVWYSTDYFS
jgi:hypothetical protein